MPLLSIIAGKLWFAGLITCFVLFSGSVKGIPGNPGMSGYSGSARYNPSSVKRVTKGVESVNISNTSDKRALGSSAFSGESVRSDRLSGDKGRNLLLQTSTPNTPSISNSVDGFLNGYFFGQSEPVASYRITASNLSDNLSIIVSAADSDSTSCGIVISFLSDTGFSSTITLVPSGGLVDTTIYVRPDCMALPFISQGTIIHSSNGAANDTVSVHLQNDTEYLYAPVVTIDKKRSMPSSVVLVPFYAENFNGLNKVGYYIDFNPAVLSFSGFEHINATLPDTVCNNCPHSWICCDNPAGYILSSLSYPDSATARLQIEISRDSAPLFVPDGEKLFDLVFNYSEGSSDLIIADGYYFAGNGPDEGTQFIDDPAEDYFHHGSVGPYLPKTVLLELNIEGLYNPETGLMNQAMGRGFPENVADEITVCLAKSTFPYSIVYMVDSIQLYRTGQCRFEVPGNLEMSYYIVVRHRNSIETWTRFPVSFSSDEIIYSFSGDIHQAFKDNQLLVYDKYCILNGDINQDGFVDSGDMTILDNESSQFVEGYNQSDLNGDFSTDSGDFYIVDNNSYWFASAHRPNLPYPELVTSEVYGITSDSAWAGGEVVAMGSSTITSRGICWNTIPNPTLEHFSSEAGSGLGSFTSQLTGLMPDTTYFVSAYTANEDTLVYGNQVTFRTLAEMPVVTTAEVTSIQDEAAVSGGTIVYDGGAQITQRGVCWSTSPSPTLADSASNEGGGGGTFLSQLTGLAPYTTYYLRAYAMNSAGTAYGEEFVFTTAEPDELTDGNNYARYLFYEDMNVKDASNLLSQLRDITQGNAAGSDIFNGSGSFDSPAGWSLAPGWSISGGKLLGTSPGNGNLCRNSQVSVENAVYDIQFTIDTIYGSWVRNINCYPLMQRTAAGTFTQSVIAANGYIGINKNTATSCRIDNFTARKIAGNHLVQPTLTNRPVVRTTHIQFDGVDNYLRTAIGTNSIGTIYIVAQRVGTDSDFIVTNSLTGIGQYANKRLTIGSNDALSTFYNLRIKEILIRSSNDDTITQKKLNAYFLKKLQSDDWDVPLGKTSAPATNPGARQFIVTLIDDDASDSWDATTTTAVDYPYQGGFYTRLHPVIVAANRYLLAHNLIQPGEEIGACSATFVTGMTTTGSGHNKNKYLQLRCLQDVYGWEIANHSNSHFMTQAQGSYDSVRYIEQHTLEAEVNGAKQTLENTFGFNISSYVYPGGRHSHIIRNKVKEAHNFAAAVSYSFIPNKQYNVPPISAYALTRLQLEHTSDANGNLINPMAAFNFFKAIIDAANAEKGWLITMTHMAGPVNKNYNALFPDPTYPSSWFRPVGQLTDDWVNDTTHIVPDGWYPYPNSQLDMIYKLIIYIYEQGGRIVLPRDGIEIYGNQSTTGDVTWGVQGYQAIFDQPNYEHKAVGVDGSVTSYRE